MIHRALYANTPSSRHMRLGSTAHSFSQRFADLRNKYNASCSRCSGSLLPSAAASLKRRRLWALDKLPSRHSRICCAPRARA